MVKYKGGCHCGKIAFEVEGDLQQVVECNCSMCSRRGGLLWFVPRQQLGLGTPAADYATYTFNNHRIKHHFCPTCGIAPFSEASDKSGNPMAAVNARCLEGVEISALKVMPFDGRSL
jgi:hypothetical protein